MFGNLKRETRHPQTLGHRPIHIRGASIFLCAAPPLLISHSSETFKRDQRTACPQAKETPIPSLPDLISIPLALTKKGDVK